MVVVVVVVMMVIVVVVVVVVMMMVMAVTLVGMRIVLVTARCRASKRSTMVVAYLGQSDCR